MNFEVRVIFERDGAGYHVFCPALKGLHTYGETVKEAKRNAEDAIVAYIQSAQKHNDPLPIGCLRPSEKCKKEVKGHNSTEMVLRPCLQC